jgi:hypothetical protein
MALLVSSAHVFDSSLFLSSPLLLYPTLLLESASLG